MFRGGRNIYYQKIDRNTLTNFKPDFPQTKNQIEIKELILLDSPLTLLEKKIEIEKHSKNSMQAKEMFRKRSSVIMIQSLIRGCLKRVGYYSLKKSYQVNATIIQRGIRAIFSKKAILFLQQTNINSRASTNCKRSYCKDTYWKEVENTKRRNDEFK